MVVISIIVGCILIFGWMLLQGPIADRMDTRYWTSDDIRERAKGSVIYVTVSIAFIVAMAAYVGAI
jgi:ABC-type enterobactin transport system permease subunit